MRLVFARCAHRIHRGRVMLAALLALGVAAVPRAAAAQATAEEASAAFTKAVIKGDYAGAARLMHPDAVHQIRILFEPLIGSSAGAPLAQQIFGLTAAKFATTSDTVLFANFLRAVMGRDPQMLAMMKSAVVTPLGSVVQPGDTALVVSRMAVTMEGVTITSYEVSPWVKYQGGYRGLLKADFTNMAAMLKAQLRKAS